MDPRKIFALRIAKAISTKGDEYYNSITDQTQDIDKIQLTARSAGFDEAALIVLDMGEQYDE